MAGAIFDKFPNGLSWLLVLKELCLMNINAKMTADVVSLAKLPHLTNMIFGEMLPAEYVHTEWDEAQKPY